MFRKIVSNLSFSPALVGQLGFYAKRLKKEEATRRMGLIFVALALAVQSLAVFQPPESANASSSSDLVSGGLGLGANRSINHFLTPYDANTGHLRDIMNFNGISRSEIANAQFSSFYTSSTTLGWGRTQRTGSKAVNITDSTGTTNLLTVYVRPLTIANGTNTRIWGWVGHSQKVGWFVIMQACGNLVTHIIPPPPTPPTPPPTPPTPPPKPPTKTPARIEQSKTAVNVSQGNINATTVSARSNDQITYVLTAENKGGTGTSVEFRDQLEDVLEYSTLIDNGGGTFDATTKYLSWPDAYLAPGVKQSRSFTVKVLDPIPATPQGLSDPSSYNCLMENTFGSDVTIPVICAPPKVIEKVVTQLPHTGPTENFIFSGIVLAVVTYFYARTRQVKKEVRLIRRDLNAGTI